jgi:hypothetical protein
MSAKIDALPPDLFKNLAERFEFHAKNIYGSSSRDNNSPLYAHLALEISHDAEILALVAHADFATQLSNLLFAAVQFILLRDPQAPLALFYPNLTTSQKPISAAYPQFRAFCLQHADEIKDLVRNRRVQTNEVGRCAALLPALNLVAQRNENRALALIEIGASAGLLLLCDNYGYNFENFGRTGNLNSIVQLKSTVIGNAPIPRESLNIIDRIGLELNPINLHNEDDIRWLEALIWPEHRDRQKLLKAALTIAQQQPLKIVGGNAAETLPSILEKIPNDAILCIFHSYTFVQMPPNIHEEILAQIIEHSRKRDIFRISQEWLAAWENPRIELFSYHQGIVESELLAYTESHGRWIEWL